MENDANAEYFIPLIWQGDGTWPSPGYSTRGSLYGVGGIPHSQWNGFQEIVGGGGTTMYNSYINMYNQLVDDVSPLEMQVGLGFSSTGELQVMATVEVTGDITTTNNKIVYIIKWNQATSYFCTVVNYAFEDFNLTSIGETGTFTHSFPMNAAWEIEDLHAVAIVQTYSGNHAILQAGQAQLTGLVAGIGSNLQSGPPSLAVQFSSLSYPLFGIESWEWDIDGDGVYDYLEENPYHLYTEPGSYDVTLRIGMEGEYDEVTLPGYITVTEEAVVSGSVAGIWHAELSPYTATGDIQVKAGDALVIESGTTVMLENGAEFLVKGNLLADARDGEMIYFGTESSWTGILIEDSQEDNIIAWCDISGATVSAVYLDNAQCQILDNVIHHNSGNQYGAAIELLDVLNPEISGNLIANNTSIGLTGGISMTNSFPNVHNNIIVNNTAGTAGAFSIKQGSAPIITNNTIAGNVGVNGAFLLFNSQPVLVNCIVQTEGSVFASIASTATVTYSCLSGGYTGEGNIDEDPLFILPSEGYGSGFDGLRADWRLQEGSLCIDAGNPQAAYNDLDESRNDMGAYGWTGFPEFIFVQGENAEIPAHLSILRAFPNPFNPETLLSYNLAEAGEVVLSVYNIRGEFMQTIFSGWQSAGEKQVVWDASRFASGIYFVRLTKGAGESFTKVILMK